jgi:hypothetical protein
VLKVKTGGPFHDGRNLPRLHRPRGIYLYTPSLFGKFVKHPFSFQLQVQHQDKAHPWTNHREPFLLKFYQNHGRKKMIRTFFLSLHHIHCHGIERGRVFKTARTGIPFLSGFPQFLRNSIFIREAGPSG